MSKARRTELSGDKQKLGAVGYETGALRCQSFLGRQPHGQPCSAPRAAVDDLLRLSEDGVYGLALSGWTTRPSYANSSLG